MNYEEYVKNLSSYHYLSLDQMKDREMFLACLKVGRLDLALQCKSFINKEFLLQYVNQILDLSKDYLPSSLRDNADFRDMLIDLRRYDLLLQMDYSVLKEITDGLIIAELDHLALQEIESGSIFNDYTKYKAMELKRYDLFEGNMFPSDEEFYDLYYEECLPLIGKIRFTDYFLFKKCMKMGNFEVASTLNSYDTLSEEELTEIVDKYWDKVVEFNKDVISSLFVDSKKLFDYCVANNRIDLACQFSSRLIDDDFISKHEGEIISALDKGIVGKALYNRKFMDLCIKHKRFDLAIKLSFGFTEEDIELYGKEILPYVKDLPYYLRGSLVAFKYILELGRYDLIDDFDSDLLTEDILRQYGSKILEYSKKVPIALKGNSLVLELALKARRFDLVEQFYDEAMTDSIMDLPEYTEYIKGVSSLPYYLKNVKTVSIALSVGRIDLLKSLLYYPELFPEELLEKYGSSLIEIMDYIPFGFENSKALLKAAFSKGKYDLIDQFNDEAFTEEVLDNYISTVPVGSKIIKFLTKTPGLIRIIEKGRYDLITKENFGYVSISDEVYEKYAEVLLTKVEFLPSFKESSVLLKYVIEHGKADLITSFDIDALNDEIVQKYGRQLFPYLLQMVNDADITPLSVFIRGRDKIKLTSLLELFLEAKAIDYLEKFDDAIFTKEIIDKYFDILIETSKKRRSTLSTNEYYLEKILENGYLEFVPFFTTKALTDEIIDKYYDTFITVLEKEKSTFFGLSSCYHLLERILSDGRIDLLSSFYTTTYDDALVDKYYDTILQAIESNNGVVISALQSSALLKRLLDEAKYDYVKQFENGEIGEELVEQKYDKLLELLKVDLSSPFAENLMRSKAFTKRFIVDCPVYQVGFINVYLFKDELKDYYPKLIQWITECNNGKIPVELIDCKELKDYCKNNGRDDLFLNFTMNTELPFGEEPNMDEIINIYAPLLGMNPELMRARLMALYSKNDEVLNTILPLMLTDRLNVLSAKHMSILCLYPDLQFEVINANDNELQLIDKILDCTDTVVYDTTSVLYNVLNNMKYYRHLTSSTSKINDEQLNNLIYILQRKDNVFDIQSMDDLTNLKLLEKMLFKFKQFDNNILNETDIKRVKENLLLKKYGISFDEAKFISDRYCQNPKIVRESGLDNNLKNLLIDINEVVNETDLEKLKFLFSASDMVFADFKSMLYLETYIREEYARLYNNTLYKTREEDLLENNENLITNQEALEKIRGVSYQDKKPKIYILREDFNLQIHALGAYSGYERPENFSEDWNRPKMASHGLCTSYIGNNQIANARAFHPILGFDSVKGSELLLSANYDIGSSQANVSYATSREIAGNFLPPQEMINNTRHTHNEMVIERMSYANGAVSKRMPSYIVYLVDDMNNKYNYMTKEELIEELKNQEINEKVINSIRSNKDTYFISDLLNANLIDQGMAQKIKNVFYYEEIVQSAVDMNVPIVLVDRLLFAKRERKKCDLMLDKLTELHNPLYIQMMMLTYFNNMIGCIDYFDTKQEYTTVFSSDDFDVLFNKVISIIDGIEDENLRINNLTVLLNSIDEEMVKRKENLGAAPRHQTNSLTSYRDLVYKKIGELRPELMEGYNGKNL